MLEVDIRSKVFDAANGAATPAIAGLRFRVDTGRFACLVGPSGCGKTTTLRIVLGLDTAFDGYVTPPEKGRVGVVFQDPRLLPWRTVEENVRLALPQDAPDEGLGALLARLGLAGLRDHYPAELSLGLARRAALARAVSANPSLLVLDEPFASLDAATAADLRALVREVWEARPTTALMVTHDLAEAVELADEILVLSDRPARLLATHPVRVPRPGRTPDWIAEETGRLAARIAAAG